MGAFRTSDKLDRADTPRRLLNHPLGDDLLQTATRDQSAPVSDHCRLSAVGTAQVAGGYPLGWEQFTAFLRDDHHQLRDHGRKRTGSWHSFPLTLAATFVATALARESKAQLALGDIEVNGTEASEELALAPLLSRSGPERALHTIEVDPGETVTLAAPAFSNASFTPIDDGLLISTLDNRLIMIRGEGAIFEQKPGYLILNGGPPQEIPAIVAMLDVTEFETGSGTATNTSSSNKALDRGGISRGNLYPNTEPATDLPGPIPFPTLQRPTFEPDRPDFALFTDGGSGSGEDPNEALLFLHMEAAYAGFRNAFGYFDPDTGDATLVIADTWDPAIQGQSVLLDVPQDAIWFLIPDAARRNTGLTTGDEYQMVEIDGIWQLVDPNGDPVNGLFGVPGTAKFTTTPGAYFDDPKMSFDGFDHLEVREDGLQAWEDLPNLGDKDFDDLIVRLERSAATSQIGSDAPETINGSALNDAIDGRSGNDMLNGNAGDDVLLGSSGNDTLNGGQGADTIDGGTGADSVSGNGGADTFFFGTAADAPPGGGQDWIEDFSASEGDIISFGFSRHPFRPPELFDVGGGDVMLRVNDTATYKYLDIHLNDPEGITASSDVDDLEANGILLFA